VSRAYIPTALRRLVFERAGYCCEYCLIPQDEVFAVHEPDHIIGEQHGGTTTADNLALACIHCNRQKGPNIASIDAETGELKFLFNPRQQDWNEHFRLDGPTIVAVTAVGRVTVRLLALNASERIEIRQTLIEDGLYP
jgi:hypothetical protein